MSTTTYTLECSEHGKSQQAKYSNLGNLVEYETYPEHVEFHMDSCHRNMRADVMVTSSWPNGTKHTETISTEVARQLWKQWVDKGYNRWLTQKT